MKSALFMLLLLLVSWKISAQQPLPIVLNGQQQLRQSMAVDPYALYYEDPTGDTAKEIDQIANEMFLPLSGESDTRFSNSRQMKRTKQVIWLQFQIQNASLSDTLRLWYYAGVHANISLFVSESKRFRMGNQRFQFVGRSGLCVIPEDLLYGTYGIQLLIPPGCNNVYFVRVADYLVLFDKSAGSINTTETYQRLLYEDTYNNRWLFFSMTMIIGCLLLMSLYSCYQFWLSRDKAFLFYTVYAAIAFIWMLEFANPRLGLGLTPPWMPWLGHPMSFSFAPILSLVYALFLSRVLSVQQEQPRLWNAIKILATILVFLQIFNVVQLFSGILINDARLYYLIDSLPSLLMGLLMIIVTLRSNSRLKHFLLAGEISLYMISLSPFHGLLILPNASPIAKTFFNYPPFFIALGLFTELFCFSLALAFRTRLIEKEKKDLQQHYAEALESELATRTLEMREQAMQLEDQQAARLQLVFDQKIATMEMNALRAQMNPHFIFNCLNSIKLYTTDHNPEKASEYLSKFSRLIRLVLENSRSERIALKDELEALTLYLEMECMRFKNKLNFSINVHPDLDIEDIEIPPMLVQPYAENAIWHGLMHKKKGGLLQINLEGSTNGRLRISIIDNGIGRQEALKLKSKSATVSKSFGMKVTGERIALINQLYKTNATVRVHDLVDETGKAAGTEVILDIII